MLGEQKHREDATVPAEQIDVETSFDNGYSLETDEEMSDATRNLEMQTERMRKLFALDDDTDVDEFLGDNPIAGIVESMELGASKEEQQVKMDYLNAKATYDGMIQRIRDNIDDQIAESDATIDGRKNYNDGQIHPAVMKLDNRRVYIVSGNVAMMSDGTMIDREKSDESIIIRDAETGKIEFSDPAQVQLVEAPLDPETGKETLRQQIRETIAQQEGDKADGVLSFQIGDTYNLLDENGAEHTAQVQAIDGQGNVQVILDGTTAVVYPQAQIQQMSDAYGRQRVVNHQANIDAMRAEEQAETQAQAQKDGMIGRSLTADEANAVVAAMEQNAEPARDLELTVENWDAEFGEDGTVETPIGKVKMGEHQYVKMLRQGRNSKLGMIKPTLTDPFVIIEEDSTANEGQITERASTLVFVKPFTDASGERKYLFTSITVQKDGQEVVISNQEKDKIGFCDY